MASAAPPAKPSTPPTMAFLEVGQKYKLANPVTINPDDIVPNLSNNAPMMDDIRKQQAMLDKLATNFYEVIQVSTLNNEVVAAKFKGLGRRMLGSGYLPEENRTHFIKKEASAEVPKGGKRKRSSSGKQTRRKQKKTRTTRRK